MRQIPTAMQQAWEAEDKTGDRRPIVRATIQKAFLHRHYYDTRQSPGGTFDHDRKRSAKFTSFVMGHVRPVVELRNIKTSNWSRSVNQDVAECTLVLLNSEMVAIGQDDNSSNLNDFEQPGAYTFSRGEPGHDASPWGYANNDRAWNGLIVPDRIVKTYEGYGCDLSVTPGRDPNLMQSGTWVIDEVTYAESGEITIKMRDLGRLLLDQMCFPPCIPLIEYPIAFSKVRTETVQGKDPAGGDWKKLVRTMGSAASSNAAYVGEGLTNAPWPTYVHADGSVMGHHPNHVLDNDDNSYWLSTGQDSFTDKVWWEFDFDNPVAMTSVRTKLRGGPYRMYVSVKTANGWVGRKDIDASYDDPTVVQAIDTGAEIPFVRGVIADAGGVFDTHFGRKIDGIRKLRLTFTRLHDTRIGEHPFNAGLRSVSIYTGAFSDLHFTTGPKEKAVGNYADYTDVIKWITAWGGFFWPTPGSGSDFVKLGPGDNVDMAYYAPDPVLPIGRVWGDFMDTGTAGVADLTADLFDKKPFFDVISYVRDIVGFNFFIDETGAPVWRMPNLFKLGNFLSPADIATRTEGASSRARTSQVVTLNAQDDLLTHETTLSGKNLRDRVFVANSTGKKGVVIEGYRPYFTGLRRIVGWTDQHFETQRECVVMADMIAAREMFDYRRTNPRIFGNPSIQIDDQIRIYAPVTNETFYHYVEGITSSLDMSTGQWTYDLTTHWLGENPSDAWVVDVNKMHDSTKAFLQAIGQA